VFIKRPKLERHFNQLSADWEIGSVPKRAERAEGTKVEVTGDVRVSLDFVSYKHNLLSASNAVRGIPWQAAKVSDIGYAQPCDIIRISESSPRTALKYSALVMWSRKQVGAFGQLLQRN
jgi:hypothetical protein